MTSRQPFKLPFRRGPKDGRASSEPPFDPTSWSGALIVMLVFAAVIWAIQIANAHHDYAYNRFGLKPRELDGLWGIGTQPFLHESYGHLLSNTVALLGIGWVLMLSGLRVWLFVTATVIVLGGFATWLVAPSNTVIVGASGLVFGWLGYLLARAYFTRRLKWIFTAVVLLVFFGTLLGSLLPTVNARVSWQSHVCGFLAGIFIGWLLHPRKGSARTRRAPVG
ncbi:MAG TPA: rhomboid family intramembrane serine protease [Jatrophihabitantaceae bacterium]|nr:rhomboid family intramembrane serine protease [Jatrophihabitantaceae bacterium]